jgi:SAM-dependent methyltransferase
MPNRELEAVEHLDPPPESPWWGEHRSRYHYASHSVRGASVLDVACGTGSGGGLLRDNAERLTGVDLSWPALLKAASMGDRYDSVLQADATRLPFAVGSFDVVVSFETIEHVADARTFLAEIRRVVTESGTVLISTPNALHTRPVDGRPRNPFHVKEYRPSELQELLEAVFGEVLLLGQRTGPHYPESPFWERSEDLPRDFRSRSRVILWKLMNRFPDDVRDRLFLRVTGRTFYPGEHDFVFEREAVERGHVLLAVCRP